MHKQQGLLVMQELEKNGYEAYFVGGCVRDWLLERSVHDIDICTDAQPCDIMRIFPNHVPTGLKHGTVSVKQGPFLYEVTTYRIDGEYKDFRRPDQVFFVSDLKEDLSRRDFTINAMAMDRHGTLVDPFLGHTDLHSKVIRAVGNPQKRFQEDALRLLRAARFAAQLGFVLDSQTWEAMKETAPLLRHVAAERIRVELHKLIDSLFPQLGCQAIIETNLLREFPLLNQVFEGSLKDSWRISRLGSAEQKWSFLLYTSGMNPEQARDVAAGLRMSKNKMETIFRFVNFLTMVSPVMDEPIEIDWSPLLLTHGWCVCVELDLLLQAFWSQEDRLHASQKMIDTYQQIPVKTLKELAITGIDLQRSMKRKPGEWIGRTLHFLLEQTALHSLPNTREDLLAAAKKEVESTNEY